MLISTILNLSLLPDKFQLEVHTRLLTHIFFVVKNMFHQVLSLIWTNSLNVIGENCVSKRHGRQSRMDLERN